MLVGLTGGIGCGKSTAVDAFRALGVAVIDADKISKDLVQAGKPAFKEIVKEFSHEILNTDGELDRIKLKERVFSDPTELKRLEAIIHPNVRREIKRQIATVEKQTSPYILVDIPLLIEKDYMDMFDRIIVVDCTTEQQIQRVKQRDNLNDTIIKSIIKKQATREKRLNAATDILNNTSSILALEKQIKLLHKSLLNLSKANRLGA